MLVPALTIGRDLLTAPGPAFLTGGLREAELNYIDLEVLPIPVDLQRVAEFSTGTISFLF